jgi:hypothetical protein
VGGLGDEGPDQIRYRVGEGGEHGVGVPPMPCRHAEGVDLRRRQFDRAVTQRERRRAGALRLGRIAQLGGTVAWKVKLKKKL